MASINKVIIIGKSLRESVRVHDGAHEVKPDPYCGFKSDVERRKALGTRVRWKSCSVIVASVAIVLTNGRVDLQGLLAWLK